MTKSFDSEAEAKFTQLVSTDLEKITVAAQCLDNQWVSQDLLREMTSRGLSLEDSRVTKRRLAESRVEYLRGLLNAQQLVVNRAYLFNNPTVYRDYLTPGPSREHFLKMLSTGVIVPFLLYENGPGEPPRFTTDQTGWPAWASLLSETRLGCLRLSWNDAENASSIDEVLYQKTRRFVGSLPFLNEEALRNDFALDADGSAGLMAVLREAAVWAMGEEKLAREDFYQRFVVRADSRPAQGAIDAAKPYAGVLKQLIDLRYNTNLPDAIDRFPLIPADSLHRTALQEERTVRITDPTIAPSQLAGLLARRRAFDVVQQPLNVSFDGLDLASIWQARQTVEWYEYIRRLRELIEDPSDFDERAQRVYTAYVTLGMRLAEIVGNRREETGPAWQPVVKVVIEAVGSTLSILYSSNTVVQLAGSIAEQVATRASTVVVRFLVVGNDRRRARNQLSTGIEIMRGRFERTRDDWSELIARFREAGFPIVETSEDLEDDPSMDNPGTPDTA